MAEARTFDIFVSKPDTITGGILTAPLGTVIEKDPSKKLDKKFLTFGLISEDGVSLSEDASDDDVKVWGGVKVRTVRSDYSASLSFTVHSTSDLEVLKILFGEGNVKKEGQIISITHNADMAPVRVFTVETKDPSNGMKRRYVVPRGQLTISGDRSLNHSSADALEVKIECLADPETGECYTEHTWMPTAAAGTPVAAVPGG